MKKRAKTTQGNNCLIDSEDEDFIAKSIKDKATYHGQRHDLYKSCIQIGVLRKEIS